MNIVWFKRDLRVEDHRALARAAEAGPVLPLYVAEPAIWAEPDMAGRHWAFVAECLEELREDLGRLGQPLIIRVGDVTEVLSEFKQRFGDIALWSHEETGNAWTFERDKAVGAWCRANQVDWHEVQNHGVQRRLASRDGWAGAWDAFMAQPITQPPHLAPLEIELGQIPSSKELGLAPDAVALRQTGG